MTAANQQWQQAALSLTRAAFGWLHANHRRGAFPQGTTGDFDDPNSLYKSLGETALGAYLVTRAGDVLPGEQPAARELLDFCWAQLSAGDLLYERQVLHQLMTDPLETYAHLAAAGYRHQPLEELFAHLTRLRGWQAIEQVPNRCLAVANACRVAGLPAPDGWEALAERTWLGRMPEPWMIDWDTAYCLTHTVFHLTDWSLAPQGVPPQLTGYLQRWLPTWLDVWAETQEWDLLAELLLVDACLPEPQYPLAAWQALAAAQRSDGHVPAKGDPALETDDEIFRRHQHPTTVAVYAGAAALRRKGLARH
jgi:hypothetical protein